MKPTPYIWIKTHDNLKYLIKELPKISPNIKKSMKRFMDYDHLIRTYDISKSRICYYDNDIYYQMNEKRNILDDYMIRPNERSSGNNILLNSPKHFIEYLKAQKV